MKPQPGQTAWQNLGQPGSRVTGTRALIGQKLYAHTGADVQIYNPELTEMDPEQV